MNNAPIQIKKPAVIALAANICLASLYFGYNIATYNSAAEVIISLNGWRGKDEETLYPALITSSLALGCIISAPIAVSVLKIFSNNLRRASMLLDLMTIIVCIIQVIDKNVVNLIIGRFLAGCIIGLNCTYVSSFVAEVSPVSMRGLTGCMNQLFICSGICICFLVSLILPSKSDLEDDPTYDNSTKWRIVVGFPVVFSVARYILFALIYRNETPSEMLKKGEVEQLKKFLRTIYVEESEIEKQIDLIKLQIQPSNNPQVQPSDVKKENPISPSTIPQDQQQQQQNQLVSNQDVENQQSLQKQESDNTSVEKKDKTNNDNNDEITELEYGKRSSTKRWLLGMLMCVGQQLTCINGVMFYSNKIFEDADQSENAIYYSIALGFIQVFATFGGAAIVDKQGRKPMMLYGTLVMTISLALIAIFLSLDLFIPSFLAICLFLISFSLSQGPLVWAYQGEILEQKALQVNTCVLWIFTLLIGIVFPFMAKGLNAGITFAIFALITLLFLIYFKKEFIETKGKSRLQIYKEFCQIEDSKLLLENQQQELKKQQQELKKQQQS